MVWPNLQSGEPPLSGALGVQSPFLEQTPASSTSMGGQTSMGQTPAISEPSVTGVDSQELTLLEIGIYLQNPHKTSRDDPAAYLRAEDVYVKHILSKMASSTGNNLTKFQRSFARKVSRIMPKVFPRLFVYQLARVVFDGSTDPMKVSFCERQLQNWGRLDNIACLEKMGEIEDMLNTGYKPESQDEEVVEAIMELDHRATRLQKKLARLADASPVPLDFTGKISREGQYTYARGAFADVWKGIWSDARGSHEVAIKVLRAPTDDPASQSKLQKRLHRQLRIWQRLKHENVLGLHGITSSFANYPSYVCPWLENGSISKYLITWGTDLHMSHRLQLLCEVASGLSYLHASGVVHGDLTGATILVADDGSACLCGFGISSVANIFQGSSYVTSTIGGSVRWMAPELLAVTEDGIVHLVDTHSDSYSYGSVTLEILSGQIPFLYLAREAQVMMQVYSGVKSRRPITPYVTDQLWAFINQCWTDTPNARPGAEELLKSMQRFLNIDDNVEASHDSRPSESLDRSASPNETQAMAELHVLPEDALLEARMDAPIDLTGKVNREENPRARGGFGDVWKGWYDADGKKNEVAIKVLRASMDGQGNNLKLQKRLRRELSVWKRLKHKNVLVLHGIASNFGPHPAFICPWLKNGNIINYMAMRGDELGMADRLQLLCEVAAGLCYLHASGVVHGDLTGMNILITEDGSACLCDFGLSSIAAEFQGTSYMTSTMSGNVRWAAPELFRVAEDESIASVNTHSDAYSYGSVAFEVLSGQVPFPNLLQDVHILIQLLNDIKPRRPATPYVTDQLWAFVNQCWADTPTDRPGAEELLKSMQRFSNEIDSGLLDSLFHVPLP